MGGRLICSVFGHRRRREGGSLRPSLLLCAVAAWLLAWPASAQSLPDLSVGHIAREPKIDYVWDSADPWVEGWPQPGEEVEWVAHVRNLSSVSVGPVAYSWSVNGVTVRTGTLSFSPGATVTATLPWIWDRARHEIVFRIDPDDALPESEERNNELLIHSDAIAVGFWIERTIWNQAREVLQRIRIGAATMEDWLQKRIRQFNEMAALAVYPETPDGVLDRWRIDAIHIVDDGTLPLSPPPPVANAYPGLAGAVRFPHSEDRSVDIQWGFPAAAPFQVPSGSSNHFDSLLHELGHARYLVDVYGWSIREHSGDVVELPIPRMSGHFHVTPHWGLMHQQYGFIDRHSAAALNRIVGHRATRGNYNPPDNLGEFLNDLPSRNRVRLVDTEGAPFVHSRVRLYQSSAEQRDGGNYPKTYDDRPDIERTTDGDGWIELPRNPFSDGPVVHGTEAGFNEGIGSNVTAILEVSRDDSTHWAFLESLDFNLAYWRGERELAEYTLVAGAPLCFPATHARPRFPYPDSVTNEIVDRGRTVQFVWENAFQEAESHSLWISVDGRAPKRLTTLPPESTSVTLDVPGGRIGWWIVTKYACGFRQSPILFFDHNVQKLPRRRSVGRR
jgi:hypothetical protein